MFSNIFCTKTKVRYCIWINAWGCKAPEAAKSLIPIDDLV